MTLTQTYEATRDLLTGMDYHRGTTLIAQRTYSYDILGRPTARNTARNGQTVNDTFAHNTRSELVGATVNSKDYEYAYDNIGNRQQATEGDDVTVYDANALNQYTAITENGADAFVPQFDADGNQTSIMTETGIWTTVYNAENRPVSFTNEATGTVVTCVYDSMGRRSFKKVTVNGTVTLHHRYLYRGYLQIACIDLTRSHHPALWFITWDPTEPIATRPLAIQKDGTWYTYGLDLTKNVCEVFSSTGYIATAYTYSPYGSAAAIGSVTQPIQWSSEVMDSELKMVYYNWRYYNMLNGRWNNKDLILSKNLYLLGNPSKYYDILGLSSTDLGTVDELKKKNCCFIFTIKVDGRNYDYSSAIALQKSMDESPERSVGHTWIRLENVTSGEVIEGGHSGEDPDKQEPGSGDEFSEFETYNGGIDYLRNNKKGPFPNFPEADPKHPFRWLFHEYNDGTWAEGSGGHGKVTGECSWCIDKQKYKQTRDYIQDFTQNKVRKYGLTQNQCTSTAAKIAEQAGINVDPYVTITLPYLVERDSRYRKIKFAAPERMQEVMKTAGSNKNMRVCR